MEVPSGWRVWNEEAGGQLVLVFRPDVFDASRFPSGCLPTIAVARGRSPDQRLARRTSSDRWHRAFYLEPDVRVREADATYEDRDAAVRGGLDLAAAFSAGEVDYRAAYHDPREGYLDALEDLLADGLD